MSNKLDNIFKANPNVLSHYDFILLDTPPSIEMMTLNAAYAADIFLLVTEYSKFSMVGLKILMEVLNDIGGNDLQSKLRTIPRPILFTMYDSRVRLSKMVEQNIEKSDTGLILGEKIARTVKIQESHYEGVPAVLRANNPAGKGYMELARKWHDARAKGILEGQTQKFAFYEKVGFGAFSYERKDSSLRQKNKPDYWLMMLCIVKMLYNQNHI